MAKLTYPGCCHAMNKKRTRVSKCYSKNEQHVSNERRYFIIYLINRDRHKLFTCGVKYLVILEHGLILDGILGGYCRHSRITGDAKLHHEARNHAEKARVIVVTIIYELAEVRSANGRPFVVDFNYKTSRAGCRDHIELNSKVRRSNLQKDEQNRLNS